MQYFGIILCMEKINQVYNVINKFIEQKGYKNNPQVLGIIFYGSYLKGTYTKWSDIDLHIITCAKKSNRGRLVLDGYIVEYLERDIDSIKVEIEIDKAKNRLAYLSMLANGKIIYQQNEEMAKFQTYIKQAYKGFECKPIDNTEIQQDKLSFFIDYERLEAMYTDKNNYFNCFYYLYLNDLRVFYQKLKGLRSDVSKSKVYKFYTNPNYDTIKGGTMPEQQFVTLYLKCINAKLKRTKFKSITKLFNYVAKQFSFNFNDAYIDIKNYSKEKPNE